MKHRINAYIKAQKQLMKAFGCTGDFFLKPLTDHPWQITGDEEMPVLSYEQNNTTQHAVIVRQNGKPLVYRASGYALVVAIDCVKIAFIFDENRELNV